ncbi:cytoplasmic copper homeostasis protein cutC [Vibrio ishigakensis]|uniref:Copper homeostasis protein cutC homolog n=2 Tax=Vibrio ishigakensis TaxID=1481914 RepID=A0A0B8NHY2_9VIBR|nr:cytoplasmic copper homeostasis protein cutC [Vibrio ishigakensis]
MKEAAKQSSIPVYAMIRPRQGDFLFNQQELDIMLNDVEAAKLAGLDGIVIGILKTNGDIDTESCRKLIDRADGMGVTFHRAFDLCREPKTALEEVIHLGCERILTSGLEQSAELGVSMLSELNQQADGRISLMAGAGVNVSNTKMLIQTAKLHEIHLSGKGVRDSLMTFKADKAQMGADDVDDSKVPVTQFDSIAKVREVLDQLS